MTPRYSKLTLEHPVDLSGCQSIRFYQGQSMHGTFLPGDVLAFTQVDAKDICIGDIVLFRNINNKPNENSEWVHRVVNIRQGEFITRGDNNPYNDFEHLSSKDIVGKITQYSRNGKKYWVAGGKWGFFKARCLHARHLLMSLLRRFCGYYYRWLKAGRLISFLWKPDLHKLSLKTDDGTLVKYLYNGRTVACWWIQKKRFDVVKPFDLVIHQPEDMQ